MDISIPFNLDDGFIRRQCPNCNRLFKWHHGPTDVRPDDAMDPPMYHCPYCGMNAGNDAWWTDDQASYIQLAAGGPAMQAISDELGIQSREISSKHVKVSLGRETLPEPPSPPAEPSDMQEVQSPCHPWEPVKILDDWREALHCIVCANQYCV